MEMQVEEGAYDEVEAALVVRDGSRHDSRSRLELAKLNRFLGLHSLDSSRVQDEFGFGVLDGSAVHLVLNPARDGGFFYIMSAIYLGICDMTNPSY